MVSLNELFFSFSFWSRTHLVRKFCDDLVAWFMTLLFGVGVWGFWGDFLGFFNFLIFINISNKNSTKFHQKFPKNPAKNPTPKTTPNYYVHTPFKINQKHINKIQLRLEKSMEKFRYFNDVWHFLYEIMMTLFVFLAYF
jgi:hypothetical protein